MRHKIYIVLLLLMGCTNSPSGAIDYSTTVYYLDGKFHKDIPEEYIFEVWGYRIVDAIGTEHTYRTRVDIPHQRKGKKWCTIHRCPEEISAYYSPSDDGYFYWVNKKKR